MDYDQFINKPFFLGAFEWTNSTPTGALVSAELSIPGAIFTKNNFLSVPWKTSCFYRMRARAIIQTAGTIKHSGVMIVSALPSSYQKVSLNTLLGVPHGFLYPNQSNATTIEIPFYNESPLRQTNQPGRTPKIVGINDDYDSYATLSYLVLNQLTAGSSVSSSVTVTTHIIIDELEFYVPAPMDIVYAQSVGTQFLDGVTSLVKRKTNDVIDQARQALHTWTGLHNPNIGAPLEKHYMQQRTNPNVIDSVVPYDSMSPYTAYDTSIQDYIFKTSIDEMDVSYLMSIPQYLSTVTIANTDVRGTSLWARPITPFMCANRSSPYALSTIQGVVAFQASHWSGPMELMIQSSMSNVQYFKLLVVLDYTRNYNTTSLGLQATPDMDDFHGTITHTLEFSGGGSVQCIDLPFFSAYRQLPCTTNWVANALQHGIVRIYLLQPTVSGDSSSADPQINMYMRCKPGFNLYGISSRRATSNESSYTPTLNSVDEMSAQSKTGEMASLTTITPQQCLLDPETEGTDEDPVGTLRPIKHLRDILRRLHPTIHQKILGSEISSDGNKAYTILNSVASLFRTPSFAADNGALSPIAVLADMFYGFRGGLRVKIHITGANLSSVTYIPPYMAAYSTSTFGTGVRYTGTGACTANTAMTSFRKEAVLPYPNVNRRIKECPLQEQANFYRRPTNIHKNAGDTYALADSVTVHDIEIPYMAHVDFTTPIGVYTTSPTGFAAMSDELGSLEISFTPTIVSPTGSDPVYSDVYITYFIGFADDARLGMLVPGPLLNPLFTIDGSSNRTQVDYVYPTYHLCGANNNIIAVTPAGAGCDAAYVA
jgi:hypothetical protein